VPGTRKTFPAVRESGAGVELETSGGTVYLLRYVGRAATPDWVADRPGEWGPFRYELQRDGTDIASVVVVGDLVVSPIQAAIERAVALVVELADGK